MRSHSLLALLIVHCSASPTLESNAAGFKYPSTPEGAIVLPAEPQPLERLAADTLAFYLEKITGRPAKQVLESPDLPTDGNIFLGRAAQSIETPEDQRDLPGDGYAINTRNGGLYLAGPMPIGTLNAVIGLLQDHLGVVWGMPHPLWHAVPQREQIALPDLSIHEKPHFAFRHAGGLIDPTIAGAPPISYYQAMRLSHPSYRPRFGFGHNLYRVTSEETYGETHPEYFALMGGKRLVGTGEDPIHAQPCFSNPDVFQITVDSIRSAFDKNPALETFSLCTNDNLLYCQCDLCAALDAPPRTWRGVPDYSGSYFDYVSRVAREIQKTHPDRFITVYAYWGAILPPRNISRLPDNVHVAITQDVSQHFDPEYRHQDMQMIDEWAAEVSTLSTYVYWNLGWLTPRYFPHLAGDYLRATAENHVYGVICEAYPNWVFQAPMLYTTFRQMWDPNLDTDSLLRHYMNSLFEDQAESLAEFYRMLEEYWTRPRQGRWFEGLENMGDEAALADAELLRRAMALLYKAQFATESETVAARLDWMIEKARLPALLVQNQHDNQRWMDPKRQPDPWMDEAARQEAQVMVQRDREAARIALHDLCQDGTYMNTYYSGPRLWLKLRWAFQNTQDAFVLAIMRSAATQARRTGVLPDWEGVENWLEGLRLSIDVSKHLTRLYGAYGVTDAADLIGHVQRAPYRTPNIDGRLDDWSADTFSPLEFIGMGERFQSTAAIAWDEGNLYVAARIEDSSHIQTHSDSGIWWEDSFQVGIDPERNAFDRGGHRQYDSDDIEVGFALLEDRPVVWCYTTPQPAPFAGVPVCITRGRDDVTIYEIALPWARIASEGKPPDGFIGINVAANNSDGMARSACAWTEGLLERKEPRLFRNVWLVER